MDLLNQVKSQLGDGGVAAIARRLGTDPVRAHGAIEQVLPLLLGGLAHNAQTSQAANALHRALAEDHANADLGGLVQGLLGGSIGTAPGEAILGHILGSRQDAAAQAIGQSTGLGAGCAGQLMALLAPLVMAALGNVTRQQNLDASQVGDLLGQQRAQMQESGLGALLGHELERDGDDHTSAAELQQAGESMLGRLLDRH
ncbi:MAG TPA: DUF937 domain-containing protein [Mizugakiibacter sp.]